MQYIHIRGSKLAQLDLPSIQNLHNIFFHDRISYFRHEPGDPVGRDRILEQAAVLPAGARIPDLPS